MIPSRPTFTRAASSVPSSFLVALKMMILAPGFSSDLSPVTKVTIGVSFGTTTFFSPSLYLTRILWPSVPATVSATVALVMVGLRHRSHAHIGSLLDFRQIGLVDAEHRHIVGQAHLHLGALARFHREQRI